MQNIYILYAHLFTDVGREWNTLTGDNVADALDNDLENLFRRYSCEGISYLTCTLPRYAQCVLLGIESGRLMPIPGFSPKGRGDARPKFLWSLNQYIFDKFGTPKVSGESAQALRMVMQITKFSYKAQFTQQIPIELCCRKLDEWDTIERELSHQRIWADDPLLKQAARYVQLLFEGIDSPSSIRPKHGPGAVSESGVRYEGKWNFDMYTDLNKAYPYHKYFQSPEFSYDSLVPPEEGTVINEIRDYYVSQRKLDYLKFLSNVKITENGTTRMIFVPKDSRGPRIIAAEPKEYMFIQQGLKRILYDHLQKHPLSAGFVNFSYQAVNRREALKGSIDRRNATIDLSAASDRVSTELVRHILQYVPDWQKAVLAVRSPKCQIPLRGRHIQQKYEADSHLLQKYAGMGSALTFPIEAIVFYAFARALQFFHDSSYRDPIYVYGDDIIMPVHLVKPYTQVLRRYNLIVNTSKSFVNSHFRESCGLDAYYGIAVNPVYLRVGMPGNDEKSAPLLGDRLKNLISLLKTSWLLYEGDFTNTSEFLSSVVRESIPHKYRNLLIESENHEVGCLVTPPFNINRLMEDNVIKDFTYPDNYLYEIMGCVPVKICTLLHEVEPIIGLFPNIRKRPVITPLNEGGWLLAGLLSDTEKTSPDNEGWLSVKEPFRLKTRYQSKEALLGCSAAMLSHIKIGSNTDYTEQYGMQRNLSRLSPYLEGARIGKSFAAEGYAVECDA